MIEVLDVKPVGDLKIHSDFRVAIDEAKNSFQEVKKFILEGEGDRDKIFRKF